MKIHHQGMIMKLRDHNENKVYLGLYSAIPATVSLHVEFLCMCDFILCTLY